MKLTKFTLKQIIKEELEKILENDFDMVDCIKEFKEAGGDEAEARSACECKAAGIEPFTRECTDYGDE